MAATTMEKEIVLEGKTTLVRRVSDLFRAEGNSSGSPLLNPTSMQKLRHCCQNLNLFPILIYSFGQPKAPLMPVSKVNLALLIARITERIYRVYSSIRYTVIKGLNLESMKPNVIGITSIEKVKNFSKKSTSETETKVQPTHSEPKFEKFQIRKRKDNSFFLKLAVYLAPFFLAFQVLGIFSLMVFGKYSPGFVFLLSALVFLGCISMKVLNHDVNDVQTFKREKRKKQD